MLNLPSIGDIVLDPSEKFADLDGKDKFDLLLCGGSDVFAEKHPEYWASIKYAKPGWLLGNKNSTGGGSSSTGVVWDGGRYVVSDIDGFLYGYSDTLEPLGVISDLNVQISTVSDVAYIPRLSYYVVPDAVLNILYYYSNSLEFIKSVDLSAELPEGADAGGLCYDVVTDSLIVSGSGFITIFSVEGVPTGEAYDFTHHTVDTPAVTATYNYFFVVDRSNGEILLFERGWKNLLSVYGLEDSITAGITARGSSLVVVGRQDDEIKELFLGYFTYYSEYDSVNESESAWGVSVSFDGSFIISDTGSDKLLVYDANKTFVRSVSVVPQDTSPRDILQLPNGQYLLAGSVNERLFLYSSDLEYTGSSYYIGDIDTGVGGLTIDSEGYVWMMGGSTRKLYQLDNNYEATGLVIAMDSGYSYAGLAASGECFWVIRYSDGYICKYDREGNLVALSYLGSQGTYARGLDLDVHGNARWVSKSSERLYLFRPNLRLPLIPTSDAAIPYRVVADLTEGE